MAAIDSALVPVSPNETIDTIIEKVRATGAKSVQLLIPDDTTALQSTDGFARLHRAFTTDTVGLLIISSDEQTLDAARRSQLETVGVQGARVNAPAPRASAAQPAAPAAPAAQGDADFLDALDQVPDAQPYADLDQVPDAQPYADLDDDDADLYASLDDLSDTIQAHGSARPARDLHDDQRLAEDDFAAELDDWDDYGDERPTRASRAAREPARRFSAADFDLGEAPDSRRGRGGQRRSTPVATPAQRRRGVTSSQLRDYDDDEERVAPRRTTSRLLIPLLIALVILALIGFWLWNSRVTIAVTPPVNTAGAQPFQNEVIPLVRPGESTTTAIQAASVSADAEATVNGQVQNETISPSGTAKGSVTIINTIESAVPLPQGAEFLGKNARGEDVRFTLDADATVPPAVTSSSASGRSTTYGQVVVNITARSAGSASNVDANAIKQILIPGQQPIVSDTSNFLIRHDPITGGSEAPQRIVTDADVQAVLGQALSTLASNGIQQLRAQIDETQAGIDGTTITPSTADLAEPQNYDPPVVQPGVGQPVDPANPVFTVTVRARFNALATPSGNSVAKQLQTVAPQYFYQRTNRPCKAGEQQTTQVDQTRWDGEKLTIDGTINCLPAAGLSADAISQVKHAVNNQSQELAAAGLQSLQQQGVIGSYQLPDRAQFPRFDWLITVNVGTSLPEPAAPAGTPSALPQPSAGTP